MSGYNPKEIQLSILSVNPSPTDPSHCALKGCTLVETEVSGGFFHCELFLSCISPPPVITRKWRKIETSWHCEGSFSSQGPKVTLCDCRFSHLSCPTSVSRPAFYWIRSIGLYCKDEENAALPTKQFLP